MGFIVQLGFLLALGICSTLLGCGLLAIVARVPLLVARQRATLWGVGQ